MYQLRLGDQFHGQAARYKILEPMGAGAYGQTYKGEVIELYRKSHELTRGQMVVIKIPTLDKRSVVAALSRLTEIFETHAKESLSMQRLRGVPCAAQVLDHGALLFDLGSGVSLPVLFIVQELIDGDRLDLYMEKMFPSGEGDPMFRGIVESACFFDLARKITGSLLQIHQREVIHGDIWPKNLMVNSKGKIVFIDFGQAWFRDLAYDMVGNKVFTHPYCAPERRMPNQKWHISADIYSLGGVLFYLATGKNPPQPMKDIDAHKNKIASAVKHFNPKLYHENFGVVDVISRCLRYSEHGRTPHAQGVLHDLDTFSSMCEANQTRPLAQDIDELAKALMELEQMRHPLFSDLVRRMMQLLCRQIEDMRQGVFDLTGSHEDIANGLSQYLSVLQAGDHYLTVTLPSFWHPDNLGINGRFLSMNKLIAQRGAVVRRIFLITPEDEHNDAHLKKIIEAHRKVMSELNEVNVQTDEWKLAAGGFYTGFKKVRQSERDFLIREGKHFGLWIKQGHKMMISPVYTENGKIVTIRFRTSPDSADNLEDYFAKLLQQTKRLTQYGQ